MKRVFILLTFLLFCTYSFSQVIEVLTQNQDYRFNKDPVEFYYISKDLDASIGKKVADVKFSVARVGEDNTLVPAFYALWKKANAMGSNAFFISEVIYTGEDKKYDITVELWFLNEEQIDINFGLFPENQIIIFGNLNTDNVTKGKGFKLNGEKMTVMPYQFITYQNKEGERASISVGGFFGSGVDIKGEKGKLPRFFTLGGVALAPSGGSGQMGLSISTGTITPLDMNLGQYLMAVLKPDSDVE